MRFLLELEPSTDLDALTADAESARAAGLDGILLRQSDALATPLVAAAALAARVGELHVAVELELGERHPLEVAEEVAVVDLSSAGRLLVVARPAPGAEEHYGEALDLLRTALTARPFRFEGRRWRVPADLPQNEHRIDTHVRLMPPPAQLRLAVWGAGAGRDEALRRGLGYVAPADADPAELGAAYAAAEAALGPALIGAPRARRERLDDPPDLVARLRAGRDAFGQDVAIVDCRGDSPSDTAGGTVTPTDVLAREVAPRVQLNRLPEGLEAFWDASEAPS